MPLDRIRREIAGRGPMSFFRFMELALYDPQAGYYSGSSTRIGPGGDFVTASDSGRALGRCLARQLHEIDARVGPFRPFHVVEFGCGRGLLARDVIDAARELHPAFAGRLEYVMVDRSATMRRKASERVPEAECLAPDRLGAGYRGALLAVELFDALPVHRVRRRAGALVEVRVDVDAAGRLVEREDPPEASLEALALRYGAAAEEGSEAELSPLIPVELDRMAGCIDRGVLLIVDYGDSAERLHDGSRPAGTLLAYHRQQTNQDYLERVGEQDLTAHVNFTAIEDRARETGLELLGRTSQDRFLISNGIVEEFDPDPQRLNDPALAKRRLQALQLIHPSGMGRAFSVLALSKGCAPPPLLDGLRDPFARDV